MLPPLPPSPNFPCPSPCEFLTVFPFYQGVNRIAKRLPVLLHHHVGCHVDQCCVLPRNQRCEHLPHTRLVDELKLPRVHQVPVNRVLRPNWLVWDVAFNVLLISVVHMVYDGARFALEPREVVHQVHQASVQVCLRPRRVWVLLVAAKKAEIVKATAVHPLAVRPVWSPGLVRGCGSARGERDARLVFVHVKIHYARWGSHFCPFIRPSRHWVMLAGESASEAPPRAGEACFQRLRLLLDCCSCTPPLPA